MLPVTDVSKWQELKASYERIFLGTSPFEPMYQRHIAEKLIVFPIEGMHLTEEQYHALVQAAAFTDDTEFYVSEIEMPDGFDRRIPNALPIGSRAQHARTKRTGIPRSCWKTHSRSGRWGVILSAEDHAVVGGSSEFMAAFRRFYPRWPLDMDAFASCWSEYARSRNADVTWISAYIDYIYK
ncbi:hypothetical protein [Brevibacillus thermoruber]|uniref:Uncharacterized protein n=1 Tax=Brevibacillus thermoruber TaxID=33942 RepID=A0A9X3TQ75_9BACL|nr:hypothetical protein [Brevibacillus thermoruber]MDA5108756.1 hypothetical protein [Brevibacillus thermoruber]